MFFFNKDTVWEEIKNEFEIITIKQFKKKKTHSMHKRIALLKILHVKIILF